METDRRGTELVEGERKLEDACATVRADALPTSARELGDGISQIGVFTEEEDQRNLGVSNYLHRPGVRSPGLVGKEYQLTKDEYEFTKEYLNKDFKKYQQPNIEINSLNDLYQKIDYERNRKDADVPKLSKSEIERLRKSLFNEASEYGRQNSEYYGENKKGEKDFHIQKPDYLIKNSEFLQKSNEFLSKITKERNYRKSDSNRDIENRLLSDYRKILKEYGSINNDFGSRCKDELSLQNFGSIPVRSGNLSRSYDDKESERLRFEVEGLRNKHQLEADVHSNDRNYSTSEDDGVVGRNADGIAAYTKGIANLLAGYSSAERSNRTESDDTEAEQATDVATPTMYHHGVPHSPNLNLRQSSPYPVESTNQGAAQGRHKNQHQYQHNKKPSLRNNDKSEKNANNVRDNSGNFGSGREHSSIGLGAREHSSGTLTSRGRMSSRRHQQSNGMASSSSSNSSISDNNDNFHDDHRGRINLENDLNTDSPPEPAPPEVPPRGPSLHHPGNTHTLRGSRNPDRTAPGQDIFLSQEYLMSGSPRNYPSKVPKSPNNGVGPNPEFVQCERDLGISKENTLASQNRLNPGLIGNPQLGVTPATPLMPVFPLRAPPANYSPYSPSRFHIDKRCQHRCTWKCFSIALILLSLILTALLAYFGAVSSMKTGLDATTCILVEDAKAVSQDGVDHVISSQSPTEESLSTSTHQNVLNSPSDTQTQQSSVNENQLVNQQQLQSHQQLHPVFNNYWPTVTEMSDFDVSYRNKINPLQFWNLEFKNKQPAFIRLNFTLPWGSNFAVYGRRNVAPTVTQYDFVEFVKGGRIDRLKRSAVDFVDHRWKRETNSVLFIQNERTNGTKQKPTVLKHHEEKRSVDVKNVTKRSNVGGGEAPTVLMVNVTLLQYFDTGIWFISVYNDDVRVHEVSLIVSEAEGVSTACPNDCSSHGSCYLGKCDCIDGYEGVDCSKSVCPVLCSNHGKYGGGVCHCEEGWKGPECDIPNHDCQVPDCSGHGKCVKGICECSVGWKGPLCNEADCLDPTCSDHGTCVNGKCYCKAGWQGANCSALDKQVYQCLPSCSDHGTYDLETGTCKCQPFWTGSDCSKALCSLDCGPHGRCGQGKCECTDGWTGDKCDSLPCDKRCSEHGQCKNGTCVCSQGWNGKHCTLPGCKNACSRHGMCSLEDGEYHCICAEEWAGDDCSIPLEQECNDEVDNDQDGMIDCSDSECCTHPTCSDHIMCLSSNDPVEVLLRKQPPSVTASFYQRVKFLIEENSVQSYAHMDEYSESRVSVMRGRVVTPQGLGIVGIRVSVDKDSRFGFTLTRNGGWYDVLVNGGGAVTLQFQRSPFKPLTKTVFVPWNQIVVLPPVQMYLGDSTTEDLTSKSPRNATLPPDYFTRLGIYFENTIGFLSLDSCLDHTDIKPVVVSSWAPEKRGSMAGQSLALSDSQIVQESISIPGSDLHLMYQSSQGAGYYSLLHMRLTGDEIPDSLTHVHVRVEIEGSVYTKMYESDPNLTHVFAWNKRNVYKQKVYGVAQAKISIGYQYSTCANVVWETQTATVEGFVVDISDIGGWSLDVHHHYNFHEGILQKGDGTTLHLKNYPRAVKVLMGTGLQRPLKCTDCNGPAKDSKLLTPVALTNGPDGSLYVGDFNLIRRITPDGNVYTVFQLSATQVSYQYYLTISPADGKLYISNPESHQILRVLILDPVEEPALNGDVVVGSGERCIPGDTSNCGDLGPAKLAKLTHPKGLAIAADKTMYIADGTNIRAVDSKDIIHTLIGHHGHNNHWQPIPCKSAISASQAQLQWPTGLALSPLDGSLYFIDDRLVLKLTSDLKIKVVAGSALHCQGKNSTSDPPAGPTPGEDADARGSVLGSLLAIAFSPSGDLYLAQSDSRKINSIKVVDSSGRISDFAGKGNSNEVRNEACDCKTNATSVSKELCCEVQNDDSNKETLLSSNAKLYQISAIAVGPDGVVHTADQGSLHILSLEHYLPNLDENGEFKIPYPATSEMYVFNRYGQHSSTKDLASGNTRYTFLYSKNTSFGKLSTVTDASGNKILFLRDYSNVVSTIENTQDHKSDLKISPIGFLTKFSQKGKSEIDLDYDSATGLLTSRSDCTGGGGGETLIYRYDKYGRVTSVILPTGEVIMFSAKLSNENKLEVTVSGLDDRETILTMDGLGAKRLTIEQGVSKTECISYGNGSLISRASWGGAFDSVSVARFPLLELSLPIEAEMLPMWSLQKSQLADSNNEMEWKYSLVGDINSKTQQTVLRDIYVNKSKVIGVELDQSAGKETFYSQENEKLLVIAYNAVGLPLSWVPQYGFGVNVSYDRFNRLESWSWGKQQETYTYERHGLLSGVTNPQDGTLGFVYNDLNMLSKLSLPSGRVFQFTYDTEGGLRHITLPSGTKHSFSCQPSLGFIRVTYTPPGSTRSYIQHYSNEGALLQTVYPGDGARVVYRYHHSGLLSEVIHGDGKSEINYSDTTSNTPNEVVHSEKDLEYKWDFTHAGGKLVEERIDYGSKTGLSNAKLSYDYDDNFRVILVGGRIGGQNLPELNIGYSPKTGSVVQIGQFKISQPKPNETTVFDGTALFSRKMNEYFQETQIAVTIHRMEVFRMEFSYDLRSRISQTRTYTRNVGVNTYTNTKNYTWDADGQLTGVEAQEPWGFKYDGNGNMLELNYRGNTIPMEYNVMDRIVKFGEGQYKYDNRGLVIQNAREERFHYNAKGLLVRATKRGRFDVRYFYDHLDRLASRKDNYGNVTQFFYTNHERPNEVSQIYSPRDGKLMSLVYDDRGHLIYAQVYRHKYYIATDECGTPVMVFNQYGEGIREIMRSPYGHIVYDSNPYLYLPVDFCGGLLDQVTSLVHMHNGQVYDPLIGQWMTPNWENILSRVSSPNHLHLYRFNGNDPINVHAEKTQLTDHESWLTLLGYNLKNLAPQLYSKQFPNVNVHLGPGNGGILAPRGLLDKEVFEKTSFKISSGFIANMKEKKSSSAQLSSIQKSKVKKISILQGWQNILNVGKPGANSEPPFGKGILVSRTKSGMAILNSVPSANPIYKDVFTSVFNRSFLLDLRLLIHGAQQDAFFFVKPETWKVSDDRGQLKRLGSQVNTTFHEKEQEMADIKIHNSGTVINLRYGTTPEKEKNRLLHHAKGQALRKAWHRERDLLRLGFPGSVEWAQSEVDEILKVGYSMSFEGEYVYDINLYPELAEDPFNIKFVKKENYKNVKKRKKRSSSLKKRSHRIKDDVEFRRHALLKRISNENQLRNHNYDIKDFNKILSDKKVSQSDNTRNTPVDFIKTDSTYFLKKRIGNKKCQIWWLSWVESC